MALTLELGGAAFGDFRWDTYYTHGPARTKLAAPGNVNAERFYAAIDAVRAPLTGSTVCRVALTAPAAFPGCVPLRSVWSHSPVAGRDKLYSRDDKLDRLLHDLDDFGINLNGTLLEGWAGPIKIALGGEYRRQGLDLSTSAPDLDVQSSTSASRRADRHECSVEQSEVVQGNPVRSKGD